MTAKQYLLVFIVLLLTVVLIHGTTSIAGDSESYSKDNALYRFKLNERWGFIDRDGVIKIEPKYLYVDNFQEGLAGVIVRGLTEEDILFGFIDSKGEFVIEPKFYMAGPFSEGLAMVKFSNHLYPFKQDNKWGYIDYEGNVIIKPQFDEAGEFSDGLALVTVLDSNSMDGDYPFYGFINTKGNG